MNKRDRVLVLVLAEDELQRRFVYHYLRRRWGSHEIRFKIAPKAAGSAEQWVRTRYAEEVNERRTRAAQTCLLVMIDADLDSMVKRQSQLEKALDERHLNRRSSEEPIAHLIPKRNIETWILCLNNKLFKGKPINEQKDYKPHSKTLKIDDQIKPAADAFFNWSRKNADVPARCVDSLRLAIAEVKRLE